MTTIADASNAVARPTSPSESNASAEGSAAGGGLRTGSRLALGLLVSAQFVVMLDTSIVNVALPSIRADLGLSPTALTWVVNAYVLAFGGLLLLSGRAADLLGRRRVFTGGSMVFTIGTILAATSVNAEMLVAGRVSQGVGAAALSPSAMALLLGTFPGESRAKAMSAWGAASAMGGATGVLVGGLLAGSFGWASVFLVTVPFSAAAALLAGRVVSDTGRGARHHFDISGALAVTGAVIALVHGALGGVDGGWRSGTALASFTCCLLLGATFVQIERHAAEPLVPLVIFRSRTLSTGVVLALLGGAARASTFVLVALYLQLALDMAPQVAGLAMVPTSLTGFAVSLVLLPRVIRLLGPRRTLVAGLAVLAAGHLWLAHAPRDTGYAVAVLPGLLLVALGVALSFTPTTMVIAAAMPEAQTGLASGLAGSATQVGAAIGTAVFTTIAFSTGGSAASVVSPDFTAAFTAAAVVSVTTALLGWTMRSSPQQ